MKCATKTCVYECGEAKKQKKIYRTNINKSSSGVCLRFLFLFLFALQCVCIYIYWSHRARARSICFKWIGRTHIQYTRIAHRTFGYSIKYDVCTTTGEITHCVHIWCSLGAFFSEKRMRIEMKNCVKRSRILDFAYIYQCIHCMCVRRALFLHKLKRKIEQAKCCSSNFSSTQLLVAFENEN